MVVPSNELPPSAPRLVRKAAYGRTQLFLPRRDVVMREVKCMGGVVRRDTSSVFHVLPEARGAAGTACWHCCEDISDEATVVPIPRVYDPTEQAYHVYGRTCSPGCAKAYVIEHTTFDRGQHLNVLVHMLREVFGIDGPVAAAPPRQALRRFGGVFDPRAQRKAECRLVTPPFVSYCMLVEERRGAETVPEKTVPAATPVSELRSGYVRRARPTRDVCRLCGHSWCRRRFLEWHTNGPHAPSSKRQAASDGPLSKFVRR